MPSAAAIVPLAIVVFMIAATLVARRRVYTVGGDRVVVRCLEGHLFTTIWVPGVSFKAIRLGRVRLQRCPVGDHLTFVAPVKASDLTNEERRIVEQYTTTGFPDGLGCRRQDEKSLDERA